MSKESNIEYRVLSDVPRGIYCIHVVYLNKQGLPESYDPEPVQIISSSVESLSHLAIHMMSAFTKPVIDYSYFNATTDTINTAMGILKNGK